MKIKRERTKNIFTKIFWIFIIVIIVSKTHFSTLADEENPLQNLKNDNAIKTESSLSIPTETTPASPAASTSSDKSETDKGPQQSANPKSKDTTDSEKNSPSQDAQPKENEQAEDKSPAAQSEDSSKSPQASTENAQKEPKASEKPEEAGDNDKEGQEDSKKSILSEKDDQLGRIKGEIKKEENNELAISIILISVLILINNFLIDKINNLKKKCTWLEFLQNPLVTLLLGIISGIFVKIFEANSIIQTIKSGFQEFFMIILLPPILFASALNMNKFYFFKNFGAIMILAFFGTFVAIFVNSVLLYLTNLFPFGLGLSAFQAIIFSILISATDPVSVLITFEGYSCNPNLYSLIFGESILNDAITLALYQSLRDNQVQSSDVYIIKQTFFKFILLIFGSSAIALMVGFFISIMMKRTYQRIQQLNDKIDLKKTAIESARFEKMNFRAVDSLGGDSLQNLNLVEINALDQKKNKLIYRQTSLMMISPLMSYLIAEVARV